MKAHVLAATFLSACLFASTASAAKEKDAVLLSVHASVSLSAGLKFADREPVVYYEVTQPSGKVSKATATPVNNGDRAGRVTYPDDFTDAGMHPGTYQWTARANGKEIASGSFQYIANKKGFQAYVPY
ncbi:hypothetical protein LVB77_14495 [Lysobacter sp. 5GHs7-4]|uniref:hypothetical protein n=1 Tax=Lysobacter sp. 5GHs7-4 TaxID=2904253 RepID=UPI001E5FC905|nr:hypothetical protein [Lysobacter sp. 5GHs7-4]UHQ21875.1 hypothetical protein LVB77_14495 [Lysobacter sp. 5GHs7-4]